MSAAIRHGPAGQGALARGADVVGVGLVCAVGLRARFAAAAVRAGLARFRESSHFDRRGQPFVLASVPSQRLPELPARASGLTAYEERLARLALAAADEARPYGSGPLPVALALPEPHPGRPPHLRAEPVLRAVIAGARFDPGMASLHAAGRAGGLQALADALGNVERGAPLALAVAADSFDEPNLLAVLDQEDRVRADGVYDGFTPGEAGAALLLAAPGVAARMGRPVLARLEAVSTAEEPGHRYSPEPHRGDGLAAAFAGLLSGRPPSDLQIGTVYAGLNGEGLFAKEWGVAAIRNRDHLPDDCRLEHPADCLGDTGAASGLLLGVLAALELCLRPVPTLVWTTSDTALRAVALLRPTHNAANETL